MTEATAPEYQLQAGTLAFLDSGPKKLLIGGQWLPASSGNVFDVFNPGTGELLAQAALAGPEDVDQAVAAARGAVERGPWASMTGAERGNLMWKLADLVEQHADELAEIETLDNGKPIRTARNGDVPMTVKHLRYFAGWAGKLEGSTIPVSHPNQFVYTLREPMGVVGLIIPWNFPLLMCAWKLGPALACGNAAILKPAEETPLSALRLGELATEAGFPPGVINVVTGPGEPTGAAMSAHMGIDKLSFTGSTEVGRKIMAAAAGSNLKRISLELGGKSPAVVFADADLDKAVKGATWAAFSTSGQECVAGSRLFVEKPIYEAMRDGLAAQARRIRVGPGFTPKVHIGPMVSEKQLNTVLDYIGSGRTSGAEIVAGGERLGGELAGGYFLQPTVFAHQDDSLKVVQEEIFGPVVAMTAFEDWDELVARANATRYGLAAGAWTQDVSKAHRFAQAVHAGTVWINSYGLFDAAAPFGGMRESGFGREMGREALDLFSQTKTVWVGI
jgi:acyl-CoA reductase-like NAD-dependent aldehyde dehydrogenase